ncbi:hypothetical protein CLCR_01697 [Cladophialophora carrionii]|uniref:Uncharacterized protein n=1 Tax=Cladophialophora carrionii TaxID=86049 RepID=A0A1C1CBA5_9EURO|nr:hypothetical protein CLCR_01697 [Cladophialophora carrionii]
MARRKRRMREEREQRMTGPGKGRDWWQKEAYVLLERGPLLQMARLGRERTNHSGRVSRPEFSNSRTKWNKQTPSLKGCFNWDMDVSSRPDQRS